MLMWQEWREDWYCPQRYDAPESYGYTAGYINPLSGESACVHVATQPHDSYDAAFGPAVLMPAGTVVSVQWEGWESC